MEWLIISGREINCINCDFQGSCRKIEKTATDKKLREKITECRNSFGCAFVYKPTKLLKETRF